MADGEGLSTRVTDVVSTFDQGRVLYPDDLIPNDDQRRLVNDVVAAYVEVGKRQLENHFRKQKKLTGADYSWTMEQGVRPDQFPFERRAEIYAIVKHVRVGEVEPLMKKFQEKLPKCMASLEVLPKFQRSFEEIFRTSTKNAYKAYV